MYEYVLSNEAKFDLINIHHFGVYRFGTTQADKYFNSFFKQFDIICNDPYRFPSVDYINKEYRKCICGSERIYYKIKDKTVFIMAIIGSQDIYRKL